MNKLKSIKLSEYSSYPFSIPRIELDFKIYEDNVSVNSLFDIKPLSNDNQPLILQGKDIELIEITIDGKPLLANQYKLDESTLLIKSTPSKPFRLGIVSKIRPFQNTSLEGLYLSGSILTTQCEAEGFRRICFHPDRPDVLSKFRVRIEADTARYPIMLSNGNQLSDYSLTVNPSRHEIIWEDPFPKPSYLFALVLGDLERSRDVFQCKSGRQVWINLYTEIGDSIYTEHAINSLKKAMKWDEEKYCFDYDLDEYNIVAVRHFNMGAMENKGLNIFNSKLVLADSNIATDDELKRIESVIAHEYFHNWTGNRITCRDWFQLSLKEGLTVFRDQSFTADMHSFAVKRIEDVSFLRNRQFLEDSGPTSHAVKPIEYIAIDNFYTTTIYEKGAEIIRMLQVILGYERFMNGIKLYKERFDGCAATTEDFVESILEGSCFAQHSIDFNVEQFYRWYYQSGTPKVSIHREWEPSSGKLTLKTRQSILDNKTSKKKEPLLIPLSFSVFNKSGKLCEEKLLIIDQEKQDFTIRGLPGEKNKPILSLFRGFSAPVKWESDYSLEDLFYLFRCDDDSFSRWNAGQQLMSKALLKRASCTPDIQLERKLIKTLEELISNLGPKDPELLASLLTLPGMAELELAQISADPIGLYEARTYLISSIGSDLTNPLRSLINAMS